jgi:acyl carrier protein
MREGMSTLDRIKALAVKQFGGDAAAIDPDAPVEQLGVDSLGFLEFLFELEDAFSVTIDQDEAKGIRTLRELAGLVDRLITAKPPSHD